MSMRTACCAHGRAVQQPARRPAPLFQNLSAKTPIGADGKSNNTATVVGILRFDVTEDRPQGVLLKKAYLNTKVAEAHSGVTYDAAVKTALPMIVFE